MIKPSALSRVTERMEQLMLKHPASQLPLMIILTLTSFSAIAQKDVSQSEWLPDTISIKSTNVPMRYYDRKTKLAYAYQNNGNDLLFTVRGTEPAMARRMVTMGIVLSIDTLGKKKDGSTIVFPLPNRGAVGSGTTDGARPNDERVEGKRGMNMGGVNMNLETQGLRGEQDGIHPATNENGVQAFIAMDSTSVATYSVRVPFRSILGRDLTPADTLNPWSIKVTVNPFTGGGHARAGVDGQRSGGGTRGGGGMREGGSGLGGGATGGRGGGGEGEAPVMKPATFRAKFKLVFRN